MKAVNFKLFSQLSGEGVFLATIPFFVKTAMHRLFLHKKLPFPKRTSDFPLDHTTEFRTKIALPTQLRTFCIPLVRKDKETNQKYIMTNGDGLCQQAVGFWRTDVPPSVAKVYCIASLFIESKEIHQRVV